GDESWREAIGGVFEEPSLNVSPLRGWCCDAKFHGLTPVARIVSPLRGFRTRANPWPGLTGRYRSLERPGELQCHQEIRCLPNPETPPKPSSTRSSSSL